MLQGLFPIHRMIRENSLQINVLVFMLKRSLSRFHMKGNEQDRTFIAPLKWAFPTGIHVFCRTHAGFVGIAERAQMILLFFFCHMK
jgi:hypothetical protein